MDWQLVVVILIVAAAVLYLARSTWRMWSARKAGCGGGCGCGDKSKNTAQSNGQVTIISPEQITLRRGRDPR